MHAACSQEDRHTQRPGLPAVSPAPGQPTHAHKMGYVHKPPHARTEGPDPCQGKRREGHVLGGDSRRWGPEEGGRQQTGWPAAQTDNNNKDGNGDFQRRSGCTQHRALAWMHLPARERLVPWGTIAISEKLGWRGGGGGPALGWA